jgi:hypothetical protein
MTWAITASADEVKETTKTPQDFGLLIGKERFIY